MKKLVLWLILLVIASACELLNEVNPNYGSAGDAEKAGLELFQIDGGDHSSTIAYRSFSGKKLTFEALFDSTAIYTTADPANQADINKLYGFSDCSSHHHTNSARFGWRWYNSEMQIFAYAYNEGERTSKYLATVPLNEKRVYNILVEDDSYIFQLNGKEVKINRSCSGEANGYKLYPYFGGDETAPKDIQVWLKEVE